MFACEFRKANVLHEQFLAPVFDEGRAGQGRGHGWRIGEAVPEGGMLEAARVGVTAVPEGDSVSGRLARPAAASPLGSTNGPFWPQAASRAIRPAAIAARTGGALTRIWWTPNIWKL